jgi:hypothetical protein
MMPTNPFFLPSPDMESDVMRPIDPLLLMEDGYGRAPQLFTLGVAPVDPMYPGDVFTPTTGIYGPFGHPASPALNGLPEMLDVFNAARFLFEER